MLIYYALGRLGVQQAREAAQSALPDAPVIHDQRSRPPVFRMRTAGALHRLPTVRIEDFRSSWG